jgi:seryl-tRNA synthetase
MIDIELIRTDLGLVKKKMLERGVTVDLDALLHDDAQYRTLLREIETLRSERKSKGVHAKDDPAVRELMKALKEQLTSKESTLNGLRKRLDAALMELPNLHTDDVPIGKDETGNQVIRTVGEPTKLSFEPKDHVALGKTLGVIDTETATTVAGPRFTYLKGGLVLLQNALVDFAFSVVTNQKTLGKIIRDRKLEVSDAPFVPVVPPLMIKPDVFQRMGRLEPREERYHIPSDDLYLIGSAEHTLGPLHMNETLKETELPIRYVAFTPAFRREAGTYGKDLKGILRLHQFDKIEMESFCLPESSLAEQEFFVAIQEYLLAKLGIPYHIVNICTGDMGAPDARQIDVECWMPGQNRYRETHTADLMTDYQARRLNTRVKRTDGSTQFVHMNDATCIAIGRTLIAIMENYQQADGSIIVPKVLQPYTNGLKKIGKK